MSLNKVLINTNQVAEFPEISYIDNPEFVFVKTDNENRIFYGVKQDGEFFFGAGCPHQVRDYVEQKLAELSLDEYEDIVAFLNDYLGSDTTLKVMIDSINAQIATKVDKVEGKSLIDAEYADSVSQIENPEFAEVHTDTDDKILYGVKRNGDFYFGVGIPSQIQEGLDNKPDFADLDDLVENKVDKEEGKSLIDEGVSESQSIIEDSEGRSEITTDDEGKIISYRDSAGMKHENVGVESTMIITNSLKLTSEGMTEFQKALKDSGFQPGGSGDYTDKDSMEIGTPRLAHLNIIGDVVLENLLKEGMAGAIEGVNYNVPVAVEFSDGQGNYFKKYALLSGQGRSSLGFVKRGLGLDFFNEDPNAQDFDEDNTFKMKFGDWVSQDSFHCKSYYTDFFRATTAVTYKLAEEVIRTRGIIADRPYKKYYVNKIGASDDGSSNLSLKEAIENGARCIPDGFPIIVYHNGEFWGVNSLQLKKHRDNYMMKKNKANNILLDCGEAWSGFINANGNINWGSLSGTYGIEIRNPKDLYCTDGSKYKGELNQKEIVDTTTAESWIAAGVMPNGKAVTPDIAEKLRITGKVRENMEELTTYSASINALISGGATDEEIKAEIAKDFDVNSLIDYILLIEIANNKDAYYNNIEVTTWGKLSGGDRNHWSINIYDCDISFGTTWLGNIADAPDNTNIFANSINPYRFIFRYFAQELKDRYKYLRDNGIFTADHITNIFKEWMDRVGYDNYSKEYEKWNEAPCFRDGSCNSGWRRISNGYITDAWNETATYAKDKILQYDYIVYKSKVNGNVGHNPALDTEEEYWKRLSWDSTKTYQVGDTCYYGKYHMYEFEATSSTTNIAPLKKLYNLSPGELGFYGSLYRIYRFMIEELSILDSQLDYNI